MTASQVRRGVADAVRAAGPEYWLLAIFVATATNLLDFAVVPAPGMRPGAAFVAAAGVRVAAVFLATYALARRMAGAARPWAIGMGFARFCLFSFLIAVLFGVTQGVPVRLLGGNALPLATQWLAMFGLAAAWGVILIRLIGASTGLAMGARFGAVPALVRAARGSAVGLALAFVQIALPLMAIHLALTLVGVRLPLEGHAVAALALVDGVVSGAQLIVTGALSVVAWRQSEPPLRGGGVRG